MQIEVEFMDEFGKDLIFPVWPGEDRGMPPASKLQPNRLVYSHAFIAQQGHSLSLSDKIGAIKQVIVACTPMLNPNLAMSLRIDKLVFNNVTLEDHRTLGEYQIRVNTAQASLTGHKLEMFKATTHVVVNVHNIRNEIISIDYGEFHRATTTCNDLMERIQTKAGIPINAQHIVREYPSLRPVKLIPAERLLGFPGKFERGIWVVPSHSGPIFPASIPTPPELKLKMVEAPLIDLLDEEQDWHQKMSAQQMWEGEIEAFSGAKDVVKFNLDVPTQPVCKMLRLPGAINSVLIHPLLLSSVLLKNASNQPTVVAEPDPTPVKGLCRIKPSVLATDVDHGPKFLPPPLLLSKYKKEFAEYEMGKSFGAGTVTLGQDRPMRCTYRLKVGFPTNRIIIVAEKPGATRDADSMVIFEGELAKGISETLYIRGVYYEELNMVKVPEALKRPFCTFQLTIGCTVPEVVTSPMGIRYAGLKSRSFTSFAENFKLDAMGDQADWVSIHSFIASLPRSSPRLALAQVIFEDHKRKPYIRNVAIFWCFPAGSETHFCATYSAMRLVDGAVSIRTSSSQDLLEQLSSEGAPIGVGTPAEDVLDRMSTIDRAKLPKKVLGSHPTTTLKRTSLQVGQSSTMPKKSPAMPRSASAGATIVSKTNTLGTSLTPPAAYTPATTPKTMPRAPPQTRYAQPSSRRPSEEAEEVEPEETMTFAMNVEDLSSIARQPTEPAIDALSFLDAIYKREESVPIEEPPPSPTKKTPLSASPQKRDSISDKRASSGSEPLSRRKSVDAKPGSTSAASASSASPSSAASSAAPISDEPSKLSRSKSARVSKKSSQTSVAEGKGKEGCVIA